MSLMEPEPTGERHEHRIDVDPSMTGIDAWTELCIFGQRITFTGPGESFTVTGCDGIQCQNIGVGSLA